MGFFGRRKPAEPPPTAHKPAEPPKTFLPRELWDDPRTGGLLKQIGLTPDDAQNRPVTHDDVQRMIDAGRQAIIEKSRRIHEDFAARDMARLRVRPFWLIPDKCWNGDCGHFLIYMLRLNPYEDWNVIWLPEDEISALVLDAPQHPRQDIPPFVTVGEQFIGEQKRRLMAAHAETMRTHEFGKFGDVHDQTIEEIKKLARYFHAQLIEAHNATKDADAAPRG